MIKFIDSIFGPVKELLQSAIDKLTSISMIANRGITLDKYLGWFSRLGDGYVFLFKMIIACLFLVVTVFIVKKIYQLYQNLKDGAKWW